ncbi:hypothetical protein KQX54_002440 [Cotesia glomerata]|uniref:Uncharacterized protein n=1 Tax=Cotesia glomerata TaxID=32391 RepID=A0AAV7HNI3_COTGL|nr:hypothetical protein KQX54_002440 [Cotesia glomerata]
MKEKRVSLVVVVVVPFMFSIHLMRRAKSREPERCDRELPELEAGWCVLQNGEAHIEPRYSDVHVLGVVVYTRVPYTKWESKVKGTERMKNATKSVCLSAVVGGCWLPMLLLEKQIDKG